MTLTFEAVKRWVMEQFHSKREHISVTRGTSDAYRPVIVGSDGKLDGSLLDRADIFSDAEGDPAAIGTAADGASTYAARRNHVHDIAADYVDNTRLRNSGALSVIGRSANSTGDPADISATAATDAVLRESGSVLGFGTIATAGIAANAVSNAKLAQMAQATIKGRASAAGTGDPTDLTAAQLITILLSADGATSLLDADFLDGLNSIAFAILAGQSGGQTLNGDTASGGNLTLHSTANATKGKILLGTISAYDQANDALGIGTTSPNGLQVNTAVSETARGADNVRIGIAGGTPRIILEDSGSTQWEIDNSAALFRIFVPGVVKLTLDTSGNLVIVGTLKTTTGNAWDLKGYTTTAPAATGYVTVNIDGTNYKLLASNV